MLHYNAGVPKVKRDPRIPGFRVPPRPKSESMHRTSLYRRFSPASTADGIVGMSKWW